MDKYTYLLILQRIKLSCKQSSNVNTNKSRPPFKSHPAHTFDPIKTENAKMTELELESGEISSDLKTRIRTMKLKNFIITGYY